MRYCPDYLRTLAIEALRMKRSADAVERGRYIALLWMYANAANISTLQAEESVYRFAQ